MKVQYVNSILSAVKKVFISMLEIPVTFENPINKKIRHPSYKISSIIEISGSFSCCIVLSYPEEMAIVIASDMLDEQFSVINDEIIDAIAEIANMVTGVADSELNIENVSYSLPSVFLKQKEIVYSNNSFVFSMPCVMDCGAFEVDIALADNNSAETGKEKPFNASQNFDRG